MDQILLDLYPNEILTWVIRLILIPVISLVLVWGLHILLARFESDEFPILFKRRLALNKSIIITLFLISVYWFILIRINGVSVFDWGSFPFSLMNVYLALTPLLLTQIGLIVWYFKNNQKTLNQI